MSITRLHDSGSQAHEINALDATTVQGTELIVTPVRTKENRLKLITWRQHADGTLSRLADSGASGPFIGRVACPQVSAPGRIFTATRNGEQLALTEWKVNTTDGTLTVVTSGVFGPSATTALGVGHGLGQSYVTVVRNTLGEMRLASFKEGGLAALNNAKAGAVSDVSRPVLADVFMTPVILDCAERLRLIAWVAAADGSLTRIGDSGDQAGEVSRISCAHIGGKWATAVRDSSGRLKVIFWQVESGTPKRIGDSGSTGPPVIDVDVQGLDFNDVSFGAAEAEWRVLTAVRVTNGRLRLLSWSWKQASGQVVLVNDSGDQPEPISLLRLVGVTSGRFLTVVRDDSTKTKDRPGHLKLITWNVA